MFLTYGVVALTIQVIQHHIQTSIHLQEAQSHSMYISLCTSTEDIKVTKSSHVLDIKICHLLVVNTAIDIHTVCTV